MNWVEGNKAIHAVDRAVGKIDRLFARASDAYLERSWKDTKARAIAADSFYAEIEQMRHTEKSGIVLFDPNNPKLGWAAWEYQNAVEAVLRRDTAALKVARWVSSQPLSKIVNGFIASRQRVQRGWDFRAVYGLDHHLTSTLGPQLEAAAELLNDRDDAWLDEMKDASKALTRYSGKDDIVLGNEVAPGDMIAVEADIAKQAAEAIHWVADNLTRLSK